jgi:hypothetical protein
MPVCCKKVIVPMLYCSIDDVVEVFEIVPYSAQWDMG